MKKLTLFLVAMTMSLLSFAQSQMSGTYTVGTGGSYDYSSMADAGMAIKAAEFTGDVTLLICTDLTENINTGIVNKSEYTLTIRPDKDENRTITYTTATDNTGPTGVFVIGGDMTKTPGSTIGWASIPTKNVIVDGAAEGKTTPRLKITTGKWATNFLLYGDVQDVVVKNCILVGRSSSTAYSLAFRSERYSETSKNIGPKNCVVENCIIESASTLSQVVYCQGNEANSYAGYPTNITIRNCSITSHLRGIFLYGVNNFDMEGCVLKMLETPAGYMCHGVLGNTTKGVINIKGNKFIKNSTKNANAGEYGLQTITASGGATEWVIENNYFAGYDALASGTTTKESRLVGIRCGDYCVVRHNTFHMPKLTYAPGTSLVGTHAVALLWLAGSHKYPVQNNIFVCEETTANVSLIRGGLKPDVTGNVFYHKGGKAAIVAAAPSCTTFVDLETSYPAQAATSKWTNVTFADAANGDLSLAGNSNGDETLAVSRLAEVLTDITGKSRREQTYAGAYEGANFPSNMPSSITLTAYPVQDYSASIVGTMKRAIQNGENTIVLTHEADGTPHIYSIEHSTKTVTELSQEGVVAVNPNNANDYLAISDIALTEDGKLIACNYMRCSYSDATVGTTRYYIWNDLASTPSEWFTSSMTANSTLADVGYTFAVKGTSDNAQVMTTAVHNNNRAARINLHTVVNGAETAYHRFGLHTSASEYTEAKQGTNFQITATPLDNIWALEGELTDPTSFAVPATIGDPYTGTALKNTDLGKKYTGASYLNYDGHYLMVAPYANGEGKLAGVKVLGITLGFDDAISVATSTDLSNAIDATAAAATAYVDGDGDLTIYLIADAKVYAFSQKVPTAQSYTVTAIAGEGGTVEGGGLYEEGSTAIVTASPAEHYDFVNWTEGEEVVSTTAEYSFTVTKDIELTANFQEHAKYTITAHAADNTMGYVTGAGTYYIGETVTLKATAKTGYYFTGWSDSNTDNPRTFTATENVTLQANFATAYPRVYAYNLNVVNNGDDTYTFSFKPNTDAISGNLLLYSEDGTTVAKTVAITTPIIANTVNSITLSKIDLPDQSDIPWAIELSGNAIPAFAETFADSDLRFARAHAVVDNSPESEYFGRVYVADRRSTKSNSKVYVYNPDFTDLTATNLGLATAGYSRPAVGADGTLYLTGYTDGAEAGIFVVDPADLTKCTQFFNGTYDSDGLYTNNGKEIGSSTSGVGVYGSGKDAVLYTMMEDGSNANFISGKQPIVKYQIGQENGTVLKQWSDEPTWWVNYPAKAADKSYNFGNNDFAATAKGVWVSQNKSNPDDRPEIAFVDKTGTILFMQNSKPCLGGGMTVNADNTVLYIVEDSKILEYAITWNENKPSLTLSNTYPISLQYISTLSVDYAGNLIACAGTTYSTTDNNVMKVVRYTLPTDDNTCTVPAAKAKALKLGTIYTVEVAVNDPAMGTAIGAGEYLEGETATVTATANADYRFVNWTNGAEVLSTEATYSFTVIENTTLTANFAPLPEIAYELNGGVWNKYGWTSKKDMYNAFIADWKAYSGSTRATKTYEEQYGIGKSNGGIPTTIQGTEDILGFMSQEKWAWLGQFLDAIATAQGTKLPSEATVQMRFALGNFFGEDKNKVGDSYVDAIDCSAGQADLQAFAPYWGQTFPMPTQPTEEVVLSKPYKEYYRFDGWYAEEDFSGTPVTTVDQNTDGTLYAKWIKHFHTREVTNGEYGTICLPYASSNYSGAEFYEVSWMRSEGANAGLYLDEVAVGTTLEAGKPYIFRATDDLLTVYYEGDKVDAPIEGANGLTGTFALIEDKEMGNPSNVLEGNYLIAQNKIWLCEANCSLYPNRAYIKDSDLPKKEQSLIPGRRRVCMGSSGENTETGTENALTPNVEVIKRIENGQVIIIRDGVKYNLQGQKIQ